MIFLNKLFNANSNPIYNKIEVVFDHLKAKLNLPYSEDFSFEYDQIVSLGEVLSSYILSAYLSEINFSAMWIDARELIQTDNNFQEANVDWEKTEIAISKKILPKIKENKLISISYPRFTIFKNTSKLFLYKTEINIKTRAKIRFQYNLYSKTFY